MTISALVQQKHRGLSKPVKFGKKSLENSFMLEHTWAIWNNAL